ncbi:MAG: class I SAM-dependent methyltransferase, partial [Dehalococcoidia bacterium]
MNQLHLEYCASDEWATLLAENIIPWTSGTGPLGPRLLEVGPGPGRTTEILRARAATLTAVELDPDLASALRKRMTGTNVTVIEADATALPLEAASFDVAVSFTMLHHVPTPELQDRIFAEVARV